MNGPATSIAQLNSLVGSSPPDGTLGIIRTGSSTDQTDTMVTWDATRGNWVTREFVVSRSTDNRGALIPFFQASESILGFNVFTGLGSGAWFSTSTVRRMADLMNAGFAVEYRFHAFMQPDPGAGGAPVPEPVNQFWNLYQMSTGDARTNISSRPPATPWAQTATVTTVNPPISLDYQWVDQTWATLQPPGGGTLAAPTKQAVFAFPVGYVDAGTVNGNGATIDSPLVLRLIG